MIQGYISTSTRMGRGKRRRYIRNVYLGPHWDKGIKTIREILHILPKGSKGFLSSMITGKYKVVTKRKVKEV